MTAENKFKKENLYRTLLYYNRTGREFCEWGRNKLTNNPAGESAMLHAGVAVCIGGLIELATFMLDAQYTD